MVKKKIVKKSTHPRRTKEKDTKINPKASEKYGRVNIEPLGDMVLIRPLNEKELEKKSNFGIIIPDTVDEDEVKDQGVVVAVGKGSYDDGKLNPMTVKEGDRVMFSKYGFDEITYKEEKFFILKEENILAIIK